MLLFEKAPTRSKVVGGILIFSLWVWAGAILLPPPLYGQSDSTDSGKTDTSVYPERREARESWEKIVSFPGRVILFPFKIIFRGTNEAVSYFFLPQRVGAVYDFLHSDDGLRAAEPTYSGPRGPGFKIFQKNLINEGSKLQFKVNLGLRYRQRYQLKFERVRLFGGAVNSEFLLSYTLQPDESFFGIGPNTSKDDRTSFLHERAFAEVGFGKMSGERVEMSTSFSFEQNNIRGGKHPDYRSITEAYNLPELPGLESKLRMLGIGIALRYDSRNSMGRPTSGTEILLSGGVFDQIEKNDYRYWKVNTDVRQYLHLFFRRAVMFRLAGEMTEPLSDRAVPFYHLSELGRSETIRGFSRGRFRDLDMLLGSVEYYYPIWQGRDSGVDAFLFVDAGQVANNIVEDFDPGDLQVGFGGGFRFSGELSESIRVMVAKSKERFRFYLDLNL